MRHDESTEDIDRSIPAALTTGQRTSEDVRRLAQSTAAVQGLIEALQHIAADRCEQFDRDTPKCINNQCLECFQDTAYLTLEKHGLI